MQDQRNVLDCYNKTAQSYADKFKDEFRHKHLDRILLKSFVMENFNNGRHLDLGCGPGQATRFLFDCGQTDITGTDLSPEMVRVAKQLHPSIHFETGDMLNLHYEDKSISSVIALYSIIHFNYDQVKTAFKEIKRILKHNGQFLFSFHIGTEPIHFDTFLDHEVNIDFHFFETGRIINLLCESGFSIIDIIEREPYPNVEYPSKRAYIWCRAFS